MMNLEIKHEIGKVVYYIKTISIPNLTKCPVCLSEGVIFRKDGSEMVCPICKGTKAYSNNGTSKEVVVHGKVDHIETDINSDGHDIYYFVEKPDVQDSEYVQYDEILENYLFDTAKEAAKHLTPVLNEKK